MLFVWTEHPGMESASWITVLIHPYYISSLEINREMVTPWWVIWYLIQISNGLNTISKHDILTLAKRTFCASVPLRAQMRTTCSICRAWRFFMEVCVSGLWFCLFHARTLCHSTHVKFNNKWLCKHAVIKEMCLICFLELTVALVSILSL